MNHRAEDRGPGRSADARGAGPRPSALDRRETIVRELGRGEAAVFLDYDGTLTPIVERPEHARLSDPMREAVARLAGCCPVAVVSGRDRADVESLVGLNRVIYAGSHGFDISGPGGLREEHEAGRARLPDLDAAARALAERLRPIAGAQVERKRFAIAVHDRRVADTDRDAVASIVDQVHARHRGLRKTGGKRIHELRPDVDWDKGRAVRRLLGILKLERPVPLYIGDDETDEDAFRAIASDGIGIRVADDDGPAVPTTAMFLLHGTEQVRVFLVWLAATLRRAS